ncbi:hypothetical protein E2C01_022237 [Portunus trituberculatus]|uniref:Uncharacterized protein n=1 Tax=Portunus trituberculatus TaxID=210409 RepID=A0A5B7E4W7_PORTR|nr:hypothetical protein [Portunus trituberculatus]
MIVLSIIIFPQLSMLNLLSPGKILGNQWLVQADASAGSVRHRDASCTAGLDIDEDNKKYLNL